MIPSASQIKLSVVQGGSMKYVDMVNEQVDVNEAEARKDFGKGDKREDYADAWSMAGNVVLIGLPGSGKGDLARLIGEKTQMKVRSSLAVQEAIDALGGENQILVLEDSLVEMPEVQGLIHGAGKVFYLMADSKTLSARVAEREGVEDPEELWRELSARLAVMEPQFYGVLHFILQATESPEELLGDALEKIAF